MGSCATGTCTQSKAAGGPGCYMCDTVTPGLVTYRTSWQRGFTTVRMQSIPRADAATRREAQLTKAQNKSAAKAKK